MGRRFMVKMRYYCSNWNDITPGKLFEPSPPNDVIKGPTRNVYKYSQNWANDHLPIATTIFESQFQFYNKKLPLKNDHLLTTTTKFGSQG